MSSETSAGLCQRERRGDDDAPLRPGEKRRAGWQERRPRRDSAELLERAEAALDAWREVNDHIRETAAGDAFIYEGGMNAIEHAREMTEHYVGYKITGQR